MISVVIFTREAHVASTATPSVLAVDLLLIGLRVHRLVVALKIRRSAEGRVASLVKTLVTAGKLALSLQPQVTEDWVN